MLGRLKPGVTVSYWDDGPGGSFLMLAKVVRARGAGVVLTRDGDNFRVPRNEVVRVLSADDVAREAG